LIYYYLLIQFNYFLSNTESNKHMPLMPKTPNPRKRSIRNRKIVKRRSSFKRWV